MVEYLPVFAMLVLATLFAGLSFLASRLLAPRRQTAAKLAPYECGIVPDREPAERFPVRFFLVAMIFIIFDIEIIFLFPWAVIFTELGVFGLAEMGVFAVAVFISFLWLISRGALDWAPARVSRPLTERVMRTSENTVVRLSNRTPLAPEPGEGAEPEPAVAAVGG